MQKNIMLDLEVLGGSPDAVILSIGAAYFGDELGKTFYTEISIDSCISHGLKMAPDTILWWMRQSDQARKVFENNAESRGLLQALSAFADFVDPEALIWGNGSDFDNVILANAYKAIKCAIPWRYFNSRCFRTLKSLFPEVQKPDTAGVKHNALDDAVSQAYHAMKIFDFIKQLNGRIV